MFHIKVTPRFTGKALGDMSEAEHRIAERIKTIAEPYVPSRTGALVAGTTVTGNMIRYPGPAANILYQGRREGRRLEISKAVHPQAQDHWVYGARKDHADEIKSIVAEEIKEQIRRR